MDSHVKSVHDQYTQDPLQHPGGTLGGEEEHHEKKSVLKKVKAKAKKIKNTIASKAHGGHGHGHDEHGHDDHDHHDDHHDDEEEEYDEEEEVAQDPEVHGAPMYESAAAQNFSNTGHHQDAGLGANLGPKIHFDQNPNQHVSAGSQAQDHSAPPNSAIGHTAYTEQSKPALGENLGEDLSAPKHDTQHVSPANYQTKATDPGAGGEEAGVAPILHKLDRMHIHDESQNKNESVPESFNSGTSESHPQDMNVDTPAAQPQQGGGGYISSVTSAAIAAKNAVASKMGYGGNGNNQQPVGSQTDQPVGSQTGQPAQPSSYTEKLSSAANVTTDKAAAAKNVVASKLGSGGATHAHPTASDPTDQPVGSQTGQRTQPSSYTEKLSSATNVITDKAAAAKNVVASKLGYGGATHAHPTASDPTDQPVGSQTGQPAQPSSYTEKLSSATNVITDKAAAAKNVVASKLGYGGATQAHPTDSDQSDLNRGGEEHAKSGAGATGYGRQIADKLAPVYGTVAGVGSAVMSKMPGTGTGTGTGTRGDTDPGYFAEKLRPGDDHKALSEMITGAFGKRGVRGEEQNKAGEDVKRENKPMGKVSESEEVAKRLGSTEEEKSGEVPKDVGKEGVVDKFKGAFTNWFGKGGEMNPSQAFNDHSQTPGTGEQQQGISRESGENLSHEGERKLQTN